MKGKSFALNMLEDEQIVAAQHENNTMLWHKRLGHFDHNAVFYMKKNQIVEGLPDLEEELPICATCQYGKQTRLPFPQKAAWKSTQKLQLVHTDVSQYGKQTRLPFPQLKGSKYYIAFIDDFTRFCWIYFLTYKSEVADVFLRYKAMVENQSEYIIKVIRSDNGTEYTSEKFNEFCEDADIDHQLTAPYTPQQNGVVERKNRTIMEMTRCLLHEKELPKSFWAEAANTAVFLLNKLPTKALQKQTSFEAWFGYKPMLMNLKTFGCLCFSYVPQNQQYIDEDVDELPVKGFRALFDIYQRCNIVVLEPAGFVEAAENKRWRVAMQEELNMIDKNNTWELVDRPSHKKPIGVKWVYRTKLNSDGSINKHKARLVVKGYAQMFGVDFSETFAPVARLDTIRMLLALAAQRKWKIYQLDVKSAFLNGYLEEEIFVEQPEDLGEMSYFLGMEVHQKQNEIFICQQKYAKEILKKFKMEECKSTSTPMNQKEKFCKEDGAEKVDEGLYRSMIGCLMYLTATRPDIMHAVSLLSRYMHCASEIHFQAAKRVIRYVKGTVDYGIKFSYCFSFGSGVFSWSSRKQEVVAQSTAEAEYIAAAAAVNQALWLRKLLTDFGYEARNLSFYEKDLEFAAPKSRRSVESYALVAAEGKAEIISSSTSLFSVAWCDNLPCFQQWRIYVYTRETNYDPLQYPEPFTFNPWRWLDKSLESQNYCFLFGAGNRVCPGKELGIVKISMFLHHLVTRYRWEEVGDAEIAKFPRVEAPKGLHIKITKY
ncbi:Retrovirus-related Pol polyprotein from transposon TNT 1-94 [Vitis vinifera]|uniref:Retrovirus-related Pol polyprotein from transposon TNT 1-94 n=1 Tax=Vitis vinifera TaxID=29760 RepID=A0A438J146_VITVI|nr:Retrovirus-related Pol polyprotein from transposon TNT 1-94 [Vitis vinifera]